VPKRRIVEAVREGAGDRAAQLIEHLKKGDMAKEAVRLLADAGWLPEPLRLDHKERSSEPGEPETEAGSEELPAFLSGDEEASDEDVEPLPAIAAE
jgi:ParB family chromosome partitioning protein